MIPNLVKYPRTRHVEGSRLQPGDEDLGAVPFAELAGLPLVIEEKLDGANCALRFSTNGELLLQSRGHYLTGGPREKHFTMLKQWAYAHAAVLRERLGSRFIMFGEWLFAKHTIYYDDLPHYFHEFDIWDTEERRFLSTKRRRERLAGLPIVSVPVLATGVFRRLDDLKALIGPSRYITAAHRDRLDEDAERQGLSRDRVTKETDPSGLMEGLYIKHEDDESTLGRFKWIRPDFLTSVTQSESHWLHRPILPNRLREDADLFGQGSLVQGL